MSRLNQSILWGLFNSTVARVLQFMGTLVLARLLVPEAFGLFAVAQGITMFLGLLISAGWLETLVRRKDENPKIYNTVFTFQLVLYLIAWVVLWLGSSHFSQWLGDSRLEMILLVLGVTLFSRPIFIYHAVYLHRQMHFKRLAKINIIIAGVTLLLTVLLAFLEAGVWSLVVGRVVNAALLTFLISRSTGEHPQFEFNFSILREVFHDAYRFSLLKGMDHLMDWGPYAMVSRLHGAGEVGYLQRAISAAQIPIEISGQAVNAPMFRAYAATDDGSRREYYLFRALSAWVLYIWLAAWLLHIYSDTIISTMYGSQWTASAPLLGIYAWYLFFFPLQSVSRNYITSCRGPGTILKLRMVMLGVLTGALFVLNDNLQQVIMVIVSVACLEAIWSFGLAMVDIRLSIGRLLSIVVAPVLGVLSMVGVRQSDLFSGVTSYGVFLEMGLAILMYSISVVLFPGGNLEAKRWRERILQLRRG